MTTWELWDLASGNAVGDFDAEADALAEIRAMMDAYGPDVRNQLELWALERHNEDGTITAVASGVALIEMATKLHPGREAVW